MAGEHILAIDNGTQSVRALLFDLQGEFDRQEPRPHPTLLFSKTGLGRTGSGCILAGRLPGLPGTVANGWC
jgi:glycerol kinase